MWTGIGDITITQGGQVRTFTGTGGLLRIDGLTYATGLNVQSQTVTVFLPDATVFHQIREYDAAYTPIEIWCGLIDPVNENFIGSSKVFDGFIDSINETEEQDTAEAELSLVSKMRNGTRAIYTRQSNAAQKERLSTDTGRQWQAISGSVPIFWAKSNSEAATTPDATNSDWFRRIGGRSSDRN